MLPERLSTDLTSLGEGQERLAIVVDMTVTADGRLGASEVYRALVRNQAKLAYNGVGAWLEGKGPAPARLAAVPGLDEQLRIQDRIAQALRGVRRAQGALALETIEAVPVFHGEVLSDLRPDEKNRAHELIEDFMIAANGVSARYLASKGAPSLRRVLRTPKKWGRIVELAEQLGESLPREPSATALNSFLHKRRQADPTRFADLSLSVIKLLGRIAILISSPIRSIGSVDGAWCQACSPWDGRSVFVACLSAAMRQATRSDGLSYFFGTETVMLRNFKPPVWSP